MLTKKKKNVAKKAPRKSVSQSRKSHGKREAIVRVATEVINAKSFALATMTEIAASLDLRDATLYHYFPDKRALGYACHRSSLQRFETILQRVDEHGGPGVEKLKRFIHEMLEDSMRHGSQLYFGDYSYLDASQRKAIGTWFERLKEMLVKFLKEGMVDGSVVTCDPQYVVHLYLGMLIWLAKWVKGIDGFTPERLNAAIDAFAFHGLENRNPSSQPKRTSAASRPESKINDL